MEQDAARGDEPKPDPPGMCQVTLSRSKMRKKKFCVVMEDPVRELAALQSVRENGGYTRYDFNWPGLEYIVVDIQYMLRKISLGVPFDEPRRARTTENMVRMFSDMWIDGRLVKRKRGMPFVVPFGWVKAAVESVVDMPYIEGYYTGQPTKYFERLEAERRKRIEPAVRFQTFGAPSHTVARVKNARMPSAIKKKKKARTIKKRDVDVQSDSVDLVKENQDVEAA